MNHHKKIIVTICFTGFLLAGCWDTVNLEDRGFIVGTAIDLDEQNESKTISYNVTNQLVIPAGIGSPSQGGSGNEKPFLNITTNGNNIYRNNEEITSKTSKVPFFEHLKVLIVSEEVARISRAFPELLDTFIRDVNMRRSIKIIIAKENNAKEILDFTTPEERLPAIHINKLLDHSHKHFDYLEAMTIGDIEEAHLREKSYVLPLLEKEETLIYNSGIAFNGPQGKMVGILTPREMQGIEIASRKPVEEVVNIKYKENEMAFEIIRIHNRISIDTEDINNLKIKVNVKTIGAIKETYGELDLLNKNILKDIEKSASKHMKASIEQVIEKGQNELNTDILGIWKNMESKHYKIWKEIKDDWEQGENYFSKANFDVEVHAEIYSVGTSSKTD